VELEPSQNPWKSLPKVGRPIVAVPVGNSIGLGAFILLTANRSVYLRNSSVKPRAAALSVAPMGRFTAPCALPRNVS
jgi:hypothetical protein